MHFAAPVSPPTDIAPDRTLQRARFHAETIRAIGEAAPGDSRTTDADVRLYWEDGEGPKDVQYPSAPPGGYSDVEIQLDQGNDDEEHTYAFRGQVKIDDVWYDYEIEANRPMLVQISTTVQLPAGGAAMVPIDVDLVGLINGIDFASYPRGLGSIEIEGPHPEIDAVVMAAFGNGVE